MPKHVRSSARKYVAALTAGGVSFDTAVWLAAAFLKRNGVKITEKSLAALFD